MESVFLPTPPLSPESHQSFTKTWRGPCFSRMLRASRRGGQIFSRLKPSNFQTLQPCNALPIYPLCFQILAHSSPQRVSHNSFHVNHFRTLFRSTEGVPRVYPPLFGPCLPIPYS